MASNQPTWIEVFRKLAEFAERSEEAERRVSCTEARDIVSDWDKCQTDLINLRAKLQNMEDGIARRALRAPAATVTLMPVVDLLNMLLEMDAQFISGRPSPFARAIATITMLCSHAEGSLRTGLIDGWQRVDVSRIHKSRP